MKADSFGKKLAKKKEESVLEPLFRAARLTNDLALFRLNQKQTMGPKVRAAHTSLLPHIDLEGTRLTTLAERLGVTKQAVAPLVLELEQMGVVTKVPDPKDGRAKLVVFTPEGRRGLLGGLDLLASLEKEIECSLGKRRMEEFASTLQALIAFAKTELDCSE